MIGQTFAQYHILEKLGEGSMGVVYKAEHTRLNHLVVLKFLRTEFASDRVRRARFLQEAKIAATLDCQGIVQVIDYGDEDTENFFLVMRYCEGLSLKDRISQGLLPLSKSILYAIQIAEGLHTAHAHGVVHRDLKPSNIIIGVYPDESASAIVPDGPDGDVTTDMPDVLEQAKITDFGLATLVDSSRLTLSHTLLGTPAYMSPEQAEGKKADHRSDIWALGAVLYEMVTGIPPFGSDSPHVIMAAVRHDDPRPVSELRPEALPELVWIIDKALRKDPDARYQDTNELLRDLRLVRQKLVTTGRPDKGSWVLENRRRIYGLGSGLLVVALALLASQFFIPGQQTPMLHLGHPLEVTTTMGWEGAPAVSPDGSRIAYAGDEAGNLDIYLIPVRGGPALCLNAHPANDTDPAWMPDGTTLLFTSDRLGPGSIWKMGSLGGDTTLLLENAWDAAVSPDGSQLAFCRSGADGIPRIFVAPLAAPEKAKQLTFVGHGTFSHASPAWSPDGKTICYATYGNLWLVSAAGDQPRPLTSGGTADASPTWSADGRYVYFASQREKTQALWRVPSRGGPPERMTPGSGPEVNPGLAADGSILAYSTGMAFGDSDVVILTRQNGERLRLTGLEASDQPTLSPDGTALCYVSNQWERKRELWLQDLQDGKPTGKPRRLTDQPGIASQPQFSPDGQWLAYYRIYESGRCIWILPLDGGRGWPLTEPNCQNVQPAWSPDGQRLAFASDRDGVMALYSLEVVAGQAEGTLLRLTPPGLPSFMPTWSPDGRQIAFVMSGDRSELWITPSDGTLAARALPLPCEPQGLVWDHASGKLWVGAIWEGVPGLRSVDPVTGAVAELEPPVRFESDVSFALFRTDLTGNLMVYCRTSRQGNIWILDAGEDVF